MQSARTFDIEVESDWDRAAGRWQAASESLAALPFQRGDWLSAWYRHIAPAIGAAPRIVTVTDAATGGLVMMLPLASIPGPHGATLQFADDMLTDYNAPLLGPIDVAAGAERVLWRCLCRALPGHSSAEFRKMPSRIGNRPNPLVRWPGAHISSVSGNAIALPPTFQGYHDSIDRRVRMELERCWRVLHREPDVTFEQIVDEARGLEALATMDRQQRDRLTEMGSAFALDEPAQAAFYRDRLGERLRSGAVILTALSVKGEMIGGLYAVTQGKLIVVLRLCHAGKTWSRASPGRLILHKSIETFCRLGFETCDLSIGDYDYKRRFGTVRVPLVDFVGAMTMRGRLAAARHWAVATLRTYPELDASVRRVVERMKTPRTPQKGA